MVNMVQYAWNVMGGMHAVRRREAYIPEETPVFNLLIPSDCVFYKTVDAYVSGRSNNERDKIKLDMLQCVFCMLFTVFMMLMLWFRQE